jgi:hypothetical protein
MHPAGFLIGYMTKVAAGKSETMAEGRATKPGEGGESLRLAGPQGKTPVERSKAAKAELGAAKKVEKAEGAATTREESTSAPGPAPVGSNIKPSTAVAAKERQNAGEAAAATRAEPTTMPPATTQGPGMVPETRPGRPEQFIQGTVRKNQPELDWLTMFRNAGKRQKSVDQMSGEETGMRMAAGPAGDAKVPAQIALKASLKQSLAQRLSDLKNGVGNMSTGAKVGIGAGAGAGLAGGGLLAYYLLRKKKNEKKRVMAQ